MPSLPIAFGGRNSRKNSGLKPLPQPIQSGQDSFDLNALADAFESDNESLTGSMNDSFCSATSRRSTHSSSSARNSLRGVKPDDVLQVLAWLGFRERAQKGSHHQLTSPNLHRSITIPAHGGARQTMASGTMNSILNQMEEILVEEQSGLTDADGWVLVDKETIRAWVNEPKGNKQDIQAMGRSLQQAHPTRTGPHKKRAFTF